MKTTSLRLAPDVPDLAGLGAECFEDLMGWTEGLVGGPRAELLQEGAGWRLWRVPLPGTPDAAGKVTERPRGAGTGWIRIKRFEGGGIVRAMGARFGQPRSSSFAGREWNLLCRLREEGVPSPEPLAVGEVSAPLFSPASVLVTRELEDVQPIGAWLEERPDARNRARLSRALGVFFRRLFQAGVSPLSLTPASIVVGTEDPNEPPDCAFVQLAPKAEKELRFGDLPDVCLVDVPAGLAQAELKTGDALGVLSSVGASMTGASARERHRVLYGACLRGLSRGDRRELLARVSDAAP